MSDNIKVVVKVRPLITREIDEKLCDQWRVNNNTLIQVDQCGRECGPQFTFDKVYNKDTKTRDVFNDIAKPIVEAATAGFNGTIFAYGQTSSGKTYTMTGTDDEPGIIPLAVLNLFDIIKTIPDRDFLVRVSYVEIYNETIIDLLTQKRNLKIQESFNGVKVDAEERVTPTPEEVLEVMKEGKTNRQTGSTNMNEESSRSHSIFQITIESRDHVEGEEEVGSVNVSQLNLVDLAGSERAGQTGATGIRFKEGTSINKSLSSLALVIKQLWEDPNKHVNYRDSKLTRILQNSLGGNAKTSIICAITPAAVEETISTLQFASRAKAIKNTPAVNAVATNSKDTPMIQGLTKQLASLKTQLESKKNVEQDNYHLQKQIAKLQKLILNGFAQRNTTDLLSGARRKLHQPRRMTISTLHPIQEDPAPTIPKFCTPVLKYNPMSIASVSDFVPIQNASSLSSVVEEPRLVTPPPRDKKVNFSDEIIEIDSDDDCSSEVPCSPYHKCYESSKTPPCVLRKNAKQAEKNLKDIVELTEREKIFSHDVVELMEKLENKSSTIAKLEDELNKMNKFSTKKDTEMEKLRSKINEAEELIKSLTTSKEDLEAKCVNYETKLTDCEVCYETLKKKAKSREDELLSLLEEHENKKKNEVIGKLSSKAIEKELTNFMDMSRDISLVCSEHENSIINIDESKSNQEQSVDWQSLITKKDQIISELEATLNAHEQKVNGLENINKEFQEMINGYVEKLSILENDNSLHKSSIKSLNSTVEAQKALIDTINTDIESYQSVIQELQIKLAKKENIPKEISDIDIEMMIANEEMFLANNENMKNIIQSLQIALSNKNEEIKKLKISLDTNVSSTNISEELEVNKIEIKKLVEEIENLKSQTNDNVSVIDKLLQEKNNLQDIEQKLTERLTESENLKNTLEQKNEHNRLEIVTLKELNEKLSLDLLGKEQERESLENQITILSQKISELESDLQIKDKIISSLKKEDIEMHENLQKAKSAVLKLKNVLSLLTENTQEIPEIMDNLAMGFSTLSDSFFMTFENIATDLISEKKQALALIEEREKELKLLQTQIDDLSHTIDDFDRKYRDIVNENNKHEINYGNDTILPTNDISGLDRLKYKFENLNTFVIKTLKSFNQNIQCKDEGINKLNEEHKLITKEIEIKYSERYKEVTDRRDALLQNISDKVKEIISKFNIENIVSCKFDNDPENTYEQIILTIDKIANHLSVVKTEYAEKCDNSQGILSDAKNEIRQLTQENLKLLQDIAHLEKNNNDLIEEIKNSQIDSKSLKLDLKESKELLERLHEDLMSKTSELDLIENKAKEWQNKFGNLQETMRAQIVLLETENNELRNKCSGLEINEKQSYNNIEENNFGKSNQTYFSKTSMTSIDLNQPPSLLTICCNRIIDAINPNDENSISTPSSNTEITTEKITNICQCKDLLIDLNKLKLENDNLKTRVEHLKSTNENLLKEQQEVKTEVTSLLDLTHDLHKKVVNHRTILSTLTATTYAENKSLSSQVKFLQHHHSRFHTVCQKDIPSFKKQLQDLLLLLKSENLGRHNESFKRYSLPVALDSTTLHSTLRNESTLDGDLLMLDTNVTVTTCDNTLLGHDQTCFDVTQVNAYNEVACQTDTHEIIIDNFDSQNDLQWQDSAKILEILDSLKTENHRLRELVDDYSKTKQTKSNLRDSQSSPIKIDNFNASTENSHVDVNSCQNCIHKEELESNKEIYTKEVDELTKNIENLESQKTVIEEKYRNLSLELPSSELLVRKLNAFEKDLVSKQNEIDKLNNLLNKKNKEVKILHEENDSLSNQIMENISEVDDVKKEHDSLKELNKELTNKCNQFEKDLDILKSQTEINCSECLVKDELIVNLEKKLETQQHTKLDRSYSDTESSSRYNKICTLQNELHAGKEDCIELKEEVTTIKNHLDLGNLSMGQAMDLDESIGDPHICTFDKDKCISDIPDERPSDMYTQDKIDCLNFYLENTDVNKENVNYDVKIIDVMKLLYENIVIKHANEIENLINKIKVFEEAKEELQTELSKIKNEQLDSIKALEEKDCYLQTMANVVLHIRNDISTLEKDSQLRDITADFKELFLKRIDKEFGFTSAPLYESLLQHVINKKINEFEEKSCKNNLLNERLTQELDSANKMANSLKSQLADKENEYNLLQRQKEKMHEISTAVTLDIVKREQELRDLILYTYQKLIDSKMIAEVIDLSLPTNEIITKLFNKILNNNSHINTEVLEKEKQSLKAEINDLRIALEEKDKELKSIKDEYFNLQEINTTMSTNISNKEQEIIAQLSLYKDLNNKFTKKVEENDSNINAIEKLTEEISKLRQVIATREEMIKSLESKLVAQNEKSQIESESKMLDLFNSTSNLQKEVADLKSINTVITKEKEACAIELDKAGETIKQNKLDLERLTSDIIVLRESMKENYSITENLKVESKALLKQNNLLKEEIQEKVKACSRLEVNIKTHEKTAEIQSKMIIRLQKQKEDDSKSIEEKGKQLEVLSHKYKCLESECEKMRLEIKTYKEELEELKNTKQLLESRVSDLETELCNKPRLSMEAGTDTSRRRRQSIHDSKRVFSDDVEDHKKLEAMFKPGAGTEELFMDVDDDSSSRSTPVRLSRGRDSLLSRHEQSDNTEEHSRPSSVVATRRRRQSVHDMHRSVRHTPEPNAFKKEAPINSSIEKRRNYPKTHISTAFKKPMPTLLEHSRDLSSGNNSMDHSEVIQLRKQLSSCQQELEDLKEKYRELDEECETCAEYLREKDERCIRLKKENTSLENTITELREKLKMCNANNDQEYVKKFAHVSVNTDEDWANLHSVVVDRMSYDAEVEKNKKLMKTIEELRFKKQDLKTTMAKMQKALEKNVGKDSKELESTRAELESCKHELSELRERCRELDEECETCAEYLRERDQQCRKLREAKAALEAKLQEYQDTSGVTASVRKKRHTLHDQNRPPPAAVADAATDTGDDFTNHHAEKEIKHLKLTVDRLAQQKMALEHQLMAVSSTPLYVATGSAIVQNQQITDVMKENHKLKKINAKLVTMCKKRGKSLLDSNRENEDPSEQITQ